MGATSELYIQMQDELMNTIKQAEDGDIGILDAVIQMRQSRTQLENSLDIIKGFEREHLEEIGSQAKEYEGEYKGFSIEVRNGRKMFSYKHIPEWQKLELAKKDCEARYKAMFEAKQKGMSYANVNEDGEELPLPEISYGKSSLVVRVKK